MIPSIVLNKIYRYIWYHNQKALCTEYHKRIRLSRISHYITLDYPAIFNDTIRQYNYRNLSNVVNTGEIYDINCLIVANLPKTYKYTKI
jgi:hypothetical protein